MNRAVVLTISDSRAAGRGVDESGPAAVAMLESLGAACIHQGVLPDDRDAIEAALRHWGAHADLIVTTGGTGIAPRDVTPEAAAAVIEKPLPGFGEIMRTATHAKTPLSIIGRSGAGVFGRTLLVYLPGSPEAVRDGLALIAPAVRHVLKVLQRGAGDCRPDREAARFGIA